MMLFIAIVQFVILSALPCGGFFFGPARSCNCRFRCPLPAPCPVAPVCVSVNYASCPGFSYATYSQDCCATCSVPCRGKRVRQVIRKRREKRSNNNDLIEGDQETLIAFNETSAVTSMDPKCNSERLRAIILMSAGKDVTIAKRNIQLIAETHYRAKFNIICSADGDFSYITSTDEYCQEEVNGKTCYLFRKIDRSSLRVQS